VQFHQESSRDSGKTSYFLGKMSKSSAEHGARRATLADIAARAGVSPATASNALTGSRRVDADTAARVAAAAAALGYTPNLRARGLRTGRADTIALLSSMPFAIAGGRARMGFLMEIAGTAAVRALESGIALILVPPLQHGRAPLRDLPIDGALVVEPLADDPDIAVLRQRGLPVVAIGQAPGMPELPFVDLHSFDSTLLLLRHLQSRGARQIGLIAGAAPRHAHQEALRAYGAFITQTGGDRLVAGVAEAGGAAAAEAAALAMLRDHPQIDALLVTVDVFAVGARAAAAALGLDVPQRLMIATRYDGVHARECRPPLTVLDLHLDAVAGIAVDRLLGLIAGRPEIADQPPLPTLMPRESTAR
jgi:DNA-binding LacI/PurR family transcriptional regulator